MPVPTHLRNCVVPNDPTIDEFEFSGKVRCPCGSTQFRLLYPGATHEYHGEIIPCAAKIAGKFFFLIKAACVKCDREHLLIDEDLHGWNGFVCHDAAQAAIERPPLVPWKCLSCGGLRHSATVFIQAEGRLDFVRIAGDKFDADRWPDAFGWFDMAIRCTGCGKETPVWVSLETM